MESPEEKPKPRSKSKPKIKFKIKIKTLGANPQTPGVFLRRFVPPASSSGSSSLQANSKIKKAHPTPHEAYTMRFFQISVSGSLSSVARKSIITQKPKKLKLKAYHRPKDNRALRIYSDGPTASEALRRSYALCSASEQTYDALYEFQPVRRSETPQRPSGRARHVDGLTASHG